LESEVKECGERGTGEKARASGGKEYRRVRQMFFSLWGCFIWKMRCKTPGARARYILDSKVRLKHASSPEPFRDPREQ